MVSTICKFKFHSQLVQIKAAHPLCRSTPKSANTTQALRTLQTHMATNRLETKHPFGCTNLDGRRRMLLSYMDILGMPSTLKLRLPTMLGCISCRDCMRLPVSLHGTTAVNSWIKMGCSRPKHSKPKRINDKFLKTSAPRLTDGFRTVRPLRTFLHPFPDCSMEDEIETRLRLLMSNGLRCFHWCAFKQNPPTKRSK